MCCRAVLRKILYSVLVDRTEGNVYRVCWWTKLRETCIQGVGGQNRGKGVHRVLVGRIEGIIYTLQN